MVFFLILEEFRFHDTLTVKIKTYYEMKSLKIKTLFIIPNLASGGAERVMSYVADHLDPLKFDSQLLVTGTNELQAYTMQRTPITFLQGKKVRYSVWGIIAFIKKEKPQVVISSLGHLNTIMAIIAPLFPKIKFVGRETIVRSDYDYSSKSRYNIASLLQRWLLDAIICQSKDMSTDLISNYGYSSKKTFIINNPIGKKFTPKAITKPGNQLKFITIGRLERQKGYTRILNSLAKLQIQFKYTIIGQGPMENELKDLAYSLGLVDKIDFIPYTNQIQEHLAESDVYLQGSYVEGFPNALLESCSVGLPAVVYNAKGGINEIIEDGLNGYIVDDEKSFIIHLQKVIQRQWSPELLHRFVAVKFNEDKILEDYANFIEKIIL